MVLNLFKQDKLKATIERVNKIFVGKYKGSMTDLKFALVLLKNIGLMVREYINRLY